MDPPQTSPTIPAQDTSPPASFTGSPTSTSISDDTQTPLSLDLSALPPLITPSPPSNTLLITNLNSLATFLPQNLQHIHTLLSTPTPLNSFSPLRSLRRIIVSYPTVEAAIATRQLLDGTPLSENDRVRIYFGEPTPILGEQGLEDQHLKAPSLGKLLFISPPPSPPAGWEIREEEPPNKDVHAEDLQRALAGLSNRGGERGTVVDGAESLMSEDEKGELQENRTKSGTGSTTVYHPKDHGDNESLPAVMVIDTTAGAEEEEEEEQQESPVDGQGQGGRRILTHTARPPVELMEES